MSSVLETLIDTHAVSPPTMTVSEIDMILDCPDTMDNIKIIKEYFLKRFMEIKYYLISMALMVFVLP